MDDGITVIDFTFSLEIKKEKEKKEWKKKLIISSQKDWKIHYQ